MDLQLLLTGILVVAINAIFVELFGLINKSMATKNPLKAGFVVTIDISNPWIDSIRHLSTF